MKKSSYKYYTFSVFIIVAIVFLVAAVKVLIPINPPTLRTFGKAVSDATDYSNKMINQESEQTLKLRSRTLNGCFDSDSGFYINKKGVVYGIKDNNLFDFKDSCIDANILEEFVCIGDEYESDKIECSNLGYNFCFKGECI